MQLNNFIKKTLLSIFREDLEKKINFSHSWEVTPRNRVYIQ